MVYVRILVHLNTHYLIYFYLEYEYITLAKRQPGIVLAYFAFPLHYISLRCSQPIFSLVSNFFVKHPNCHYFYIVKYYVRHTNWYGYTMYTLFILFMGYCPCDLMFINYESVPVLPGLQLLTIGRVLTMRVFFSVRFRNCIFHIGNYCWCLLQQNKL
jgi:hypothetical protein